MPSRFRYAAILLLVLLACAACESPSVKSRLAALDLSQKAAQVLLIGVEGAGRPSAETVSLLERMPVGGVVLFGFNLPDSPAEAGLYTAALQDAVSRGAVLAGRAGSDSRGPIPLIVAIDHEGGSVFRFKGAGITRIPPPSEVGLRGSRCASSLGHAAGAELRDLGFNMALAPVVELLTDRNSRFLGSRSYGREGARVDADAGAYIRGLQAEGVAAVAKHFPGNAGEDPHHALPVLEVSREAYERDFLPRFASAIRNGVSSIMLSHVVFGALDRDRPASLSPAVSRGELRERLGFRGVAITDDLGMKALSATMSPERSGVAALVAGADLLMLVDMHAVPRLRDAIVTAVNEGRLSPKRLDEAVTRILELKLRFGMAAGLDPTIRAGRLADFPSLVERDARRIRACRASASGP